MAKRNAWTRVETIELLDILRTCCVPFLDGTINNRKGQMYRQIEHEMQRRGHITVRDARQIEHKWKNLKFAYDRYREELVQRETQTGQTWIAELKPCEFYKELEELFSIVEQRPSNISNQPAEETIVTYYDEEFVMDETQEIAVDDDTVVIEEIVYDSQDALEFEEEAAAAAAASSISKAQPTVAATATLEQSPPAPAPAPSQPAQKRKKLTVANMDELLFRICNLQQEHNESFNRSQMEFIENEFESFREKEREHLLQLKLDLEVLKQKFLERIQKVASEEEDPADELVTNDTKRRRIGSVMRRK